MSWYEAQVITNPIPNDLAFASEFSVADDSAVFGHPGYANATGRVAVFARDPAGNWQEEEELFDPRGREAYSSFGDSVAISGDTLFIGADSREAPHSGTVFVYGRSPSPPIWVLEAVLVPSDPEAADLFGRAIALDGDIAVIGDHLNDTDAGNGGAAYVFERDAAGLWHEMAKLEPPNADINDFCATSLSLSDNRIAMSCTGQDDVGLTRAGVSYIYVRESDTGAWVLEQRISSPEPVREALFGLPALDGHHLAISAVQGGESTRRTGAVYLYEFDQVSGVWNYTQKLLAPDTRRSDKRFGQSLSLRGERLAVSANDDQIVRGNDTVYLFEREIESGLWKQVAKLLPSDPEGPYLEHGLGDRVVVTEDEVIASAIYGTHGDGSVHVFRSIETDPQLTVEGDCPGTATLTVTGLTPLGFNQLLVASSEGDSTLEVYCPGTALGLFEPSEVFRGQADESGSLQQSVELNGASCGKFLQLVDFANCSVTPVGSIP